MKWVPVCPTTPVNGGCPEPEVWLQYQEPIGLTATQFLHVLPHIVGMLFFALSIRYLVRMIWGR